MAFLKEFFRFTTNREPEGFLSVEHVTYVTLMVALAVFLGIWFGKKCRGNDKKSFRILQIAAITIVSCELIKFFVVVWRAHDFAQLRSCLPLFLCSVNLFTIPLAGFCRGKLRKVAVDFILIYGFLCCIAGTYLAANYFGSCPVLSFDPMMSVTTHCISGFACVFIASAGLQSEKLKYGPFSLLILVGVECLAAVANRWNASSQGDYESNYMFLGNSAGTPFEIVNTLVGGRQLLYSFSIAALYLLFGIAFILVFRLVLNFCRQK